MGELCFRAFYLFFSLNKLNNKKGFCLVSHGRKKTVIETFRTTIPTVLLRS